MTTPKLRRRLASLLLLAGGLLAMTAAPAFAGSLAGTSAPAPSIVNLSTEGTADWAHWGRVDAATVDRKAGAPPQIGAVTMVGGALSGPNSSASSAYAWTGGTPLPSTGGDKSGLRMGSLVGGGFQFTVPADTSARTLKVYLGLSSASASLNATLSDGSAAPLTLAISQSSGRQSHVATLGYRANSPGQTLTVTLTVSAVFTGTYKWLMLESATLQAPAPPANAAPVLNPIDSQVVTEGETLSVAVVASDSDGPAPLVLDATSTLPGAPDVLSDNGNGNGVVSWTPPKGAAVGSPYSVTVTATDAAGATASRSFSVGVMAAGGGTPQQPNVVIILTDDMGYGDVGFMGQAADLETPAMDSLASQGMRFDNFHANSSVCSPTRAALLTGRYPALVGVPGTVARDPETNMGYFAPTGPTLPELLKSVGYTTAMVGKWHLGDYLGPNARNIPTRRGFDFFHGTIGAGGDYYTHDGRNYGWPGTNLMMLNETVLSAASTNGIHTTDLLTQWATEYLDSQAASTQPFLLYLSYTAPHDPIQPPQSYVDQVMLREPGISTERAKLVALIEHLDDSVAQVIQKLKDTGKYQNTLIVFTSDNGGYRKFFANNGPYRGGKLDFYEGGIRVPAAIAWPGVIPAGTASGELALTMDLYATIAEAAGADVAHPIEGRSLLPILRGDAVTNGPRDLIFENRSTIDATRWLQHYAVRRDDWKLVQGAPGGEFELYDVASDPSETLNVAADNPMVVASLTEALDAYKAEEASVPWQPPLAFERGVAKGLTDAWRTITFAQRYRAPVVVATPNYGAGAPSVVPRLRDITDLAVDHPSFGMRLQRLDGLTSAVPPTDVSYLVFEAGVYNKAHHGVDLEALRFKVTPTDYVLSWVGVPRRYVNAYAQPVVLGEVLSSNNTRFTSFWSHGATAADAPSSSVLYVGKHAGEDPVSTRSAETVGYVVTESGTGALNGETFRAGVSATNIAGMDDAPPYAVPLSGLATATSAHVTQMGMRGVNGSQALLYGPDPLSLTRINVAVDEDQLTDAERSHVYPERVGYIVFGAPSGPPTAAAPLLAPAPGTYQDSVAVALSSATPGAKVWFTTDGSDPRTSPLRALYSAPVTLTSTATVRAVTQAAGYQDSAVVDGAYVIEASPEGSLVMRVQPAMAGVSLSLAGLEDWVHWGRTTADAIDRKDGVAPQIGSYLALGGATPFPAVSATTAYSWTDGTPVVAVTANRTGLRVGLVGGGWRFIVPATTAPRTLRVYVGANSARGKLTAALSDGSAPEQTAFVDQVTGKLTQVALISFNAGTPGQTLTITYTLDGVYAGSFPWITLESAGLSGN